MFVLKMYGTNAMLAVGILGFEDLSYTYELKEDNLKVNSDKISHCVTQKQILFDRCRNNYEWAFDQILSWTGFLEKWEDPFVHILG